MNIANLFFYIHYCNGRQGTETKRIRKSNRILKHHELIFVSEGKGNITINNKRYPVKAGMLFYISPNVPLSIELDMKIDTRSIQRPNPDMYGTAILLIMKTTK